MNKEIKFIGEDILIELHEFNLEDKETMPSGKIAFSFDLESDHGGIDEIATEIIEILPIKTRNANMLHKNMRHVVMNILSTCSKFDSKSIRYSRREGSYAKSRYNNTSVSYTHITTILDKMAEAGLIIDSRGYRSKDNDFKSKESAFKITKKLWDILKRHIGEVKIGITATAETIILKDSDKRLDDYTDTPHTIMLRTNLAKINAYTNSARIKAPSGYEALQFRTNYHRVFNNSTFMHGGRFYGGFWTMIPRDARKHITINENPTCELDYSSQSICIAYGLEGATPPPGDLYAIPNYSAPHMRPVVKKALTIALGSKDRTSALRAINWKNGIREITEEAEKSGTLTSAQIQDIKKVDVQKLLEAIENHHTVIKEYFYTKYAHIIQRLDSQLAESIMLCAFSLGIPCLCLHDGFIVQETHREKMKDIMHKCFLEMFGIEPTIK